MVFGQGSLQYAQDGLMFDGNPLGCPRHWSQYNNNFACPVEKRVLALAAATSTPSRSSSCPLLAADFR